MAEKEQQDVEERREERLKKGSMRRKGVNVQSESQNEDNYELRNRGT